MTEQATSQTLDMSSVEPHISVHCDICGYIGMFKVDDDLDKNVNEKFIGLDCEDDGIRCICKTHFRHIRIDPKENL